MQKRLLVFADDFTGALDTGVQFTRANLKTRVYLWCQPDWLQPDPAVAVVVVDTESRHLEPHQAGERLFSLASEARAAGFEIIYKKTDSTLRGHIGQELLAVSLAFGGQPLMFIPAYPKMNRTTWQGIHYVNGIPLAETSYARDARNPVATSSLCRLLSGQLSGTGTGAASRTAMVPVDAVRQFNRPDPDDPVKICIFDARDQADLACIGRKLAETGSLNLTAGCAGFAEILAEIFSTDARFRASPAALFQPAEKTLVICGSAHENSLRQLENYRRENPETPAYVLERRQKEPDFWQTVQGEALLVHFADQLEKKQVLLIQSVTGRQDFDSSLDPGDIAASLARLAARLIAADPRLNLVVFGGDSLFAVSESLRGQYFEPAAEITPGVVAARLRLPEGSLPLISKAGGLGHERALTAIMDYIRQQKDAAANKSPAGRADQRGER